MKILPRFSVGMGDRFGQQGEAQLKAVLVARKQGIDVAPVWNKSSREHTLIGTDPQSVRDEADAAVQALGYTGDYFVDADHINLNTVDAFLSCSDFFTLDVAENLGAPPAAPGKAEHYAAALSGLGTVHIADVPEPMEFNVAAVQQIVDTYGGAVEAAQQLYQKIASHKDADHFAIEVSMDETETPQTPKELLGILCLLALEGIPAQTIAPKFSGRFNKGVDYVGDLEQFRAEFEADLIVVRYGIAQFGLPASLKLSVHSGSDKFTLYPIIRELVGRHGAGLHVKTAGTTWLEEIIGLAEAGGEGLAFVRRLYADALTHLDALTAPYATVLDIHPADLPAAEQAEQWTSEQVVGMVAHDPDHPDFNSSLRQLFHVAFKLAAQAGDTYLNLLSAHKDIVSRRVYDNLCRRHILRICPRANQFINASYNDMCDDKGK